MQDSIKSLVENRTLFWFRRDLRLEDNNGFYHALTEEGNVLPFFIFDTNIIDELPDDDPRVSFIYQALEEMEQKLRDLGSGILVVKGDPEDVFSEIRPAAVYTNHDYEPYARDRDEAIAEILEEKNIPFRTYKDQVIFEKDEVVKDDGDPYVVFTPYSKKWKENLKGAPDSYSAHEHFDELAEVKDSYLPKLKDIGFQYRDGVFTPPDVNEEIIRKYDRQRDYPAVKGTTRMSVHLRFGTVSIRQLVRKALELNDTWLNELIWREFYAMILWHFPKVVDHSFREKYDRVPWRKNKEEFRAWCEGRTGYPIVDAGMRELNQTGFMHNRVRMITASFLTKHLLMDWRLGEAYFAKKLMDYELSSNNGGWQWAAGSGTDAAPYFRIFNPESQTKKYDPDEKYIKKWIPEYGTDEYPDPIVDHKEARERALETYKKALNN